METTKIKMNMGGTIRAKVLQYKSDGNTLTNKWYTLTKFAEGIYLSYAAPDRYGQVYVTVVFAKNGVFWRVGCELEQNFSPDSFRYTEHVEILKRKYTDYENNIMQAATNGGWLNKLHITVMERLGHDTTAMIEAYNEARRQREARDRQQAEEAGRRERKRKEAEERRKAGALADGKEKLLKHERITVEHIELIAEAVGYKINIRTLGFMRKKVTEAVLREDDTATVWGYKLTSRNIDGTANVMRELYNRLKAQAEEEANEPVKHISEIMETCRLHDENTGEETDEYKYYKWLTSAHCGKYRTIADKALAEALAWIFEAAYRKGKGHIITMNEDGMLVETVIAATSAETPQISTEAAETVNVSVEGEKAAERAKYRVSRFGGYKIIVGDRVQGKAIAVLMSVNGHNTIEINDEAAHIATMGGKPLQTDKPIMQLSDTEVLELIRSYIEPPQSSEKKIKYFHYTPEQLKRYIIDVYEKYASGEWVLQPHKQIDTDAGLWDVVGGKIGYWTNWRREKFSEINMDFNSPTCGVCYKINRTYQKDDFIVSNEKLLEFMIGDNYYYVQKQTYSKGKRRWCYTIMDALGDFAVDDFSYTKRGIIQRFNKMWKKNAIIIWQSPEFTPQSPGTPQMVECVTESCKLAQTA